MFRFTDEQLKDALDDWLEKARSRDKQLMEVHESYMRATVLAFLYGNKSLIVEDEKDANK